MNNNKFTKEDILKIVSEKIIFDKFKIIRLDNESEDSFYDVYLIEGSLLISHLENEDGSFSDLIVGEKEILDMTGYAEDVVYYLNSYFNS